MNTERITTLLALGQLSVDLRAAELAADSAKHTYHAAWRRFECGGEPEEWDDGSSRIKRGDPKWDDAIAATGAEYGTYKLARAKVANIKRRWRTACRKAGHTS